MIERVHQPADGEPDALRGGTLQVTHLVRRVAHLALDRGQPFGREIDAALRGELEQRKGADHGGVEQEHTRVAVLPHDPRVDASGVHAALARDRVGEPERLQRRSRAHDRDRLIGPAPREVFRHHVERVRDDERDARVGARLHRTRDGVHDLDVLVQHIEAALARRRVVAGGDDQDVLVLDLVEPPTPHLDPRQQRAGRA